MSMSNNCRALQKLSEFFLVMICAIFASVGDFATIFEKFLKTGLTGLKERFKVHIK